MHVCVYGGHVCVYVCTYFLCELLCACVCVCLSGNMTCVSRLHGPLLCCEEEGGGRSDGEKENEGQWNNAEMQKTKRIKGETGQDQVESRSRRTDSVEKGGTETEDSRTRDRERREKSLDVIWGKLRVNIYFPSLGLSVVT